MPYVNGVLLYKWPCWKRDMVGVETERRYAVWYTEDIYPNMYYEENAERMRVWIQKKKKRRGQNEGIFRSLKESESLANKGLTYPLELCGSQSHMCRWLLLHSHPNLLLRAYRHTHTHELRYVSCVLFTYIHTKIYELCLCIVSLTNSVCYWYKQYSENS